MSYMNTNSFFLGEIPDIEPVPPPDINTVINQYVLRPSVPYMSPAHIVSAFEQLGPWGVPYWMQGIALQTTTVPTYITAPDPANKSWITQPANLMQQVPAIRDSGQAPTKGVYTGVEDYC